MAMTNLIKRARGVAAGYFDELKRHDLSRVVLDGSGDDLPEVQMVANLLSGEAERLLRYETALKQYADPEFWDDAMPGGALAMHDSGEMARNVLAGRTAFFHRD